MTNTELTNLVTNLAVAVEAHVAAQQEHDKAVCRRLDLLERIVFGAVGLVIVSFGLSLALLVFRDSPRLTSRPQINQVIPYEP